MVTPRNIFTHLRQSYIIHVLLSLSMGLLIYSSAESQVCQPCSRLATDTSISEQACSDIVVAANELDSTAHVHGDHESNHHGEYIARCGCDESHSGYCGVANNEPAGQKDICQDTDRNHQCECNMGDQSFPASCQRFQSTSPKRESNFSRIFPLNPRISLIKFTDLEVELDLVSVRCHLPTTLSNRPTAMSGLGTQQLLC